MSRSCYILVILQFELIYFSYALTYNNNYFNWDPNYQIVHMPQKEFANEQNEDFDYNFNAFGRSFNLKLSQSNIVSSTYKSFVKLANDKTVPLGFPTKRCHYIHRDTNLIAAISTCDGKSIHGLLLMDNDTFEVSPLKDKENFAVLHEMISNENESSKYESTPHIVKRALLDSDVFVEDFFSLSKDTIIDDTPITNYTKIKRFEKSSGLTLEVALFFDEAAYKIFSPYMNYDDMKLQDMILAYVNGIQALYHHPSLGTSLDIVLVRLEIMKRQPSDMYHYNGERSQLLDSFCAYQNRNNPRSDNNPDHWDMALYVSGLDFFAYENGKKSGVTMGLATVGGVCIPEYNCVIAELGTTNIFGKPYPSAGFTSVYIMAHEIGHNLGMHHDSSGNSCSKEGYIMSPSRGTNGETQWSSCSAQVMTQLDRATCLKDSSSSPKPNLDHTKFLNNPGITYTSKKQCEILLRDHDAVVSPNQKLDTICYSLQCKTPHRSGFYYAGPALEGTNCGNGKYCYGGNCIKKTPPNLPERPGGWSPWIIGPCSSYCLQNSLGYQKKRRVCNKPIPRNTDKGCTGSSYEVALCKDNLICNNKRRLNVTQFATDKCRDFAKVLPELDEIGAGLQAPHEELRLWMGCSIFCRRKETGTFFTPRIELNDLGISPYFPDGTWCYNDRKENYYCIQHHCLPESFQLSKISILSGIGEDVPLSQNALPNDYVLPEIQKYLSLNSYGKPIKTFLRPNDAKPPKEEEWDTKDYVELPENL